EIAALIGPRDVAGMQPAALEGFGGLLGALPVLLHGLRRTHADFARFARLDLVVVFVAQRDAARGDGGAAGSEQLRALGIVVGLVQYAHRVALGLAVELAEHGTDTLQSF